MRSLLRDSGPLKKVLVMRTVCIPQGHLQFVREMQVPFTTK